MLVLFNPYCAVKLQSSINKVVKEQGIVINMWSLGIIEISSFPKIYLLDLDKFDKSTNLFNKERSDNFDNIDFSIKQEQTVY